MNADNSIDLHYWPTPNGWKAAIMLEELGIPYHLHWVDIRAGDQHREEFLRISPNNRIPAIVDREGPDGEPISVFESGAILLYLARKFGRFLPVDARRRVATEEWLMWQMGGLGPMAGQAHHFRIYAPETIRYAVERYTRECARLYGVMDRRLEGREYLADEYSIADMACVGWVSAHERQGQDLNHFPNLRAWFERVSARPAVERALALGRDIREGSDPKDAATQANMFGRPA